jgi:hypothetical protein
MFKEKSLWTIYVLMSVIIFTGRTAATAAENPGHLSGINPPSQTVHNPTWYMHPIDDRFRGANGLSPGDVNQDGLTDYLTNYEFDQRLIVEFNPGPEKVRLPWPTITAWMPTPLKSGNGVDPESSTLGDFDGDGNLDLAIAQGWSNKPYWEGSQPGVHIVWGPTKDKVMDTDAWKDAGRIPETIDRGHFIYVLPFDVNGDGAIDIISGGRIHAGNKRKGGVVWIEAPVKPSDRRDLAKWQVHDIDPEQFSAHALVPEDIDGDGDQDIVLANADFDTPENEKRILWYENPGTGSSAQKQPWKIHVIYQGPEFYIKPQIAIADLDKDGLRDLITQTEKDVYWFRKTSLQPVTFEKIVIPKDPAARQLSRGIKVADINNDGKLEIIGMLIHKNGTLPEDKASVFWMGYSGPKPKADNWTTHVIKWGSGKTMVLPIFGEKWDLAEITDVDRDGDLDIVANCEEWWEEDIEFRFFWDPAVKANSVAVVWFENRLNEPDPVCEEKDGSCDIEAEQYSQLLDGSWIIRAREKGFTGNGYLQDHNRLRPRGRKWSQTKGVVYDLDLQGGTYYLWVRVLAPAKWGNLGRWLSDSGWFSIDDQPPKNIHANKFGKWEWEKIGKPLQLDRGKHLLTLRANRGGFAIDRIVLSADPYFTPGHLEK